MQIFYIPLIIGFTLVKGLAMNSKERFLTAARGGIPDRVPTVYYAFGASECVLRRLGLTWPKIYWSGERIAEVMYTAYEMWGHDNVCTLISTPDCVETLGVDLMIPKFDPPYVNYREPILRGPEDLGKLKLPDPMKDGSMPARIEAVKTLRKKIGNKVAILGGIGGISTWGFFIRGTKNFILDAILRPKFQKKYMAFLTECAIEFCVAQVEAGCDWIISEEDVFDSDIYSPELAMKCCGIYVKRLARAVQQLGAGFTLHCCGDTSLSIETMADTGADMLSIDRIDIADAKKRVGRRVSLMGNIKLHTLYSGTSMDVDRECRDAIMKAAHGGGYLLSSGFIYEPKTPCKNVKTLVEAARKYGVYPIQYKNT
jgi:uroporphyrinogen decarboxylase